MQITIQEVTVEKVAKGKQGYEVATVVYTDKGKNATKKIPSFAQPSVFVEVKNATPGSVWEVDLKKEGDYWNWVAIKPANSDAAPARTTGYVAAAPTGGKVTGSNYETPDERRIKQMYIIKQSSISNAIDYYKMNCVNEVSVSSVLETAQQFVDFVYGTGAKSDIFNEPNDIPY